MTALRAVDVAADRVAEIRRHQAAIADHEAAIADHEAAVADHDRLAEPHRWEEARLIAAELDDGKSARQLENEIGQSDTHIARKAAVWWRYGGANQVGRPPFGRCYAEAKKIRSPTRSRGTGGRAKVPAVAAARSVAAEAIAEAARAIDYLVTHDRDDPAYDAASRALRTLGALMVRAADGVRPTDADPAWETWRTARLRGPAPRAAPTPAQTAKPLPAGAWDEPELAAVAPVARVVAYAGPGAPDTSPLV